MENHYGSRRLPVRFLDSVALAAGVALFMMASVVRAQTWDGGGGNDNWSTGVNWNGNVAPVSNGTAAIAFGGTTRLTPFVDSPWSIDSLTFGNTSGQFIFAGDTLTIGTGGITNNDTDIQTINNAIVLNGNQTWATNAGNLAVGGAISGGFILSKAGAGTVTLTGNSAIGDHLSIVMGELQITDGGQFANTTGAIESQGTVSVGGGAGSSTWNNSSQLSVGAAGTGTLNITGGGTVTNAEAYVAYSAGGEGEVSVGGGTGNSTWVSSGELNFGNDGTATLDITGGGTVMNTGAILGVSVGGQGTVSVGGGTGSSTWNNTSYLVVGDSGAGTLNITGGGAVTNTGATLGGSPTGQGTVSVGGGIGSSTWNNTSYLVVGNVGAGTLDITSGGTMTVGSGGMFLANETNGTATVSISGTGALSSATGELYVGVAGAAEMTISGDAAVNFATMNLGQSGGTSAGTRTVNLDGGTLTLTNGVVYGLGTHTVNLNGGTLQAGSSSFAWDNHANVTATIGAAGFTFDSQGFTTSINQNLEGAGSLTKIGAGTLTLTGNSTIGGALDVRGVVEITDGGTFNNGMGRVANDAGSQGTVSVGGGTGSSAWNNSSLLLVGGDGTGALDITGGGTVTSQFGFVGAFNSGQGTVSIGGGTGSSIWNNSSSLFVGDEGTGALNITGGGMVTNTNGVVGSLTGSQGTVSVGGGTGNSTWTNGNFLTVGDSGNGTLNITGGGAVTATTGYVGISTGSQGTVSVGGGTGNSTWTNGDLYVGYHGTATLNITSGGTVTNMQAVIGFGTGGQGTVSVGGGTGNSTWTNGDLYVGSQGTGTVNITGGGTVANTEAYVGSSTGGQGTVSVGGGTGSSTWTNSGNLFVGEYGDGTLNITGGGTVTSVIGTVGNRNGGQGTVSVGGGAGSSTWNNSSILIVGYDGIGTLNITGGGTVSNTDAAVGRAPGGSNTVSVGGGIGNSTWTNSGNLFVGYEGTGTVNITGRGTVTNTFAFVGTLSGTQGTVSVGGGAGSSTWNNSFDLYVGSSGTGTLNITGGGTVTNTNAFVGNNIGSQGTVSVGGGTGSSTWNSSGELRVGDEGTGTLNITGGGTVTNAGASIGLINGSEGTVSVGGGMGSATWLNSGHLDVGYEGIGTLNITGGGTVSNTHSYVGAGNNGTVSVGGGIGISTWTTTSYISVGNTNIGTLNIIGGGTVTSLVQAHLGAFPGGNGTAWVGGGTGTSTWTIGTILYIGGNETAAGGTGALTVTDGGVVTVAGSSKFWSSGSVTVSGGTVDLGTPEFLGGALNFNTGSLAYTGALQIGATGLVARDQGTGAAIMSAGNTLGADRLLTVRGTTTIDAFRTLTLAGGTLNTTSLVNNGTLAFNSGTLGITGAGGLVIGSGGPLSGTFTLGTGSNLTVTNAITINSGNTLTINGGNASAANLDNSGTTIVSGGGLSVSGAITNLNGGRLFVGNLASFDTPGTLANNAGASIELLGGAARIGGAGAMTNNGLVLGDGEIAKPVTNAATGEIRAATGKRLLLSVANGANAGKINLQGGTAEFSQALTNSSGGLITGRGTLITGGTGLNNLGTIALSSGITDVFGDLVNNTGNAAIGLQISGNGDVTFWDDVTNTSGLFRVSAGSSATFFGTYAGGSITGTGSTYFEADVTPGFSPASITLGGDVTLGAVAELVIELAGTTIGSQYDHITVGGRLALDGVLNIALLGGFAPAAGNSFNILDWDTLSGTFSEIELPTLDGDLTWDTDDLYTSGVLSVVAPGIPGDYNNDGTADAADYVVWRKYSGTVTTLPNDPHGGTIGADQFETWRTHFGQTAGGGSGASANAIVPEPATLVLLAFAAVGWCLRRRRTE